MENGPGTTNGGGGGGGCGLRNSVGVPIILQHHLGDCVTLMKAVATVESSEGAVKLYPEGYSCSILRANLKWFPSSITISKIET